MENIIFNMEDNIPLYVQIYEYIKMQIEKGLLEQGERLPSIRGLAEMLAVSKITVEKAYDQLHCEGYIQNANRARYRVAPLAQTLAYPISHADSSLPIETEQEKPVRYNFASGEMDPDGFDFTLWKRYLNRALLHAPRLMGYGPLQGEPELRLQIAKYIQQSRGVLADPSQIIVGPSVQSLLSTLCSLLKEDTDTVAFEDPGFRNGRRVFSDYGYKIRSIGMQSDGMDLDALSKSGARLVYASPSHQFPTGSIMPIGKRNRLLAWANAVDGLIIEDDYDSEFRYYGRPIPALKGLDRSDRVVYLGSFSKIIPPSIRISYMLLPHYLLQRLQKKAAFYNQSASTTEQLALACFMEEGELERQIRRLRKRYQDKREQFLEAVEHNFGAQANVHDAGSGLFTIVDLKTSLTAQELKVRARKNDCSVALMREYSLQQPEEAPVQRILLYFSSIPAEEIESAVRQLKQAWTV